MLSPPAGKRMVSAARLPAAIGSVQFPSGANSSDAKRPYTPNHSDVPLNIDDLAEARESTSCEDANEFVGWLAVPFHNNYRNSVKKPMLMKVLENFKLSAFTIALEEYWRARMLIENLLHYRCGRFNLNYLGPHIAPKA